MGEGERGRGRKGGRGGREGGRDRSDGISVYEMVDLQIWSMAPAQNFPWNFLAPSCLRSSIVNGQRWRTLFLENDDLFSISRTSHPNRRQSIASLRPTGPPPTESVGWREKGGKGRRGEREGIRMEKEGERGGREGGRERRGVEGSGGREGGREGLDKEDVSL